MKKEMEKKEIRYTGNKGVIERLLPAFRPELRKVVEDVASVTGYGVETPMAYMLGLTGVALGGKIRGNFRGWFPHHHPVVNVVVIDDNKEENNAPLEALMLPLKAVEIDRTTQEVTDSFTASVDRVPSSMLSNVFGERRVTGKMIDYFLFSYAGKQQRARRSSPDVTAWTEAVAYMMGLPAMELTPTPAATRILTKYKHLLSFSKYFTNESERNWCERFMRIHAHLMSIILHFLGENYKSQTITASDVRHAVDLMGYWTAMRWKVTTDLRFNGILKK